MTGLSDVPGADVEVRAETQEAAVPEEGEIRTSDLVIAIVIKLLDVGEKKPSDEAAPALDGKSSNGRVKGRGGDRVREWRGREGGSSFYGLCITLYIDL